MSFSPTVRQREAIDGILAGLSTWQLLYGGGRSGKTFLLVRTVVLRALKAAASRHLIVRFRFNALRSSVIADTFPKVMRICFPGIHYDLNKTDWCAKFDNGSEVWFGGLDEGDRMEKLLGMEFATIYCNESSQISWGGVMLLLTRLAQKTLQVLPNRGSVALKLRFFFDCNPPSKAHWSYKVFKQKVNPETREPLPDPADYASFQMNPADNLENLSPEYMKVLDGLTERMKRRFKRGEFSDATPNALFDEASIDRWRVADGEELPSFVRVVVSVDPSGASDDEQNVDNDEVGIAVDALGTDGRAYLLEDLTVAGGPSTWGKVAVQAFMRHKADVIVGETNFGGGMVKHVVQTAASNLGTRVPFKMVTASRGKVQRAEPFSALYEDGRVRHVGIFAKLEDELCAFSTGGYTGPKSPNRADAHVWALSELFPAMVKVAEVPVDASALMIPTASAFRARAHR